jgi:hypothetical protein
MALYVTGLWQRKWIWLGLLSSIAVVVCLWILTYARVDQVGQTDHVTVCPEAQLVSCLGDLAERSAAGLKPGDNLSLLAENLARAGKFDAARRLAQGITTPFVKESIESAIAIFSIISTARAYPNEAAPLDKMERIYSDSEPRIKEIGLISAYHSLALNLAGSRPFDVGSTSAVVEAIKTARNRAVPRLATLDAVLQRLWQLVETAPVSQQRWRYTDLGRALIVAGDHKAARRAFTKATEAPLGGMSDVLLVRGWLELDEFGRALQLARGLRDGFRSNVLGDIADRILKAKRIDEERNTLNLAWQTAVTESNQSNQFETLRRLIKLTFEFDVRSSAISRAEEMLNLANSKKLLKEFALTTTAAAFNDLGETARAKALLEQALASIPPPDKTFAVGVHLGPISYDRNKDLADSLFAVIAVETYRIGDERGARDLLMRVAFEPRRDEAWAQILVLRLDCGQISQDVQRLASQTVEGAKFNLFTTAGAACMVRGALTQAVYAMEQALSLDGRENPNPLHSRSLDIARLADAVGRTNLVKKALARSASEALQIQDTLVRDTRLGTIAALAFEMLGDAR